MHRPDHRPAPGAGVLLLAWLSASGCGPLAATEQAAAPEAGDELPTASVTHFGERLELFLEHPYAVAGAPTKLNAHLTVLADGAPIRSGTLRAVATGPSGRSNTDVQEAPRSPGIYGPTVIFPEPGNGELTLELRSDQAEETLRIPVQVYADEDAARHAGAADAGEGPDGAVPFLKEQQWKVGLITRPVETHDLRERLTVPGELRPAAGAEAVVTPPVAGRLLPPPGGAFPRVGDRVEAGQVVAVVEPPLSGPQGVQFLANQAQIRTLQTELTARLLDIDTEVRKAEIDRELAASVFERVEGLAGRDAATERQLDEAEHALRLAEAAERGKRSLKAPYERTLATIAGMLDGSGDDGEGSPWQAVQIPLKAPHAGTVTEADAVAGEYVEASRPLFTVIDLDRLWVEARVSEFDLERVVEAPAAEFTLAAHPGRQFAILGEDGGRLIDVGSVVDPDSRTVPVRYEVANPEHRLRVGLLADVAIETDRATYAVAVPESAIVEESGRPITYVLLDGETFQKRDLELGLEDRGLVQVRSGLEPGERVVVDGAYAVRLSEVSGVIPAHGHSH